MMFWIKHKTTNIATCCLRTPSANRAERYAAKIQLDMFTSCWKQEFLFVTSRDWWAFLCDLQMYFLWYVVSLTQMIKDNSNWRLGAWPIESHSFIFWRVIFLWICLKCEKGHADKKRLWIEIKETKTKFLWIVIDWKTNHLFFSFGDTNCFYCQKTSISWNQIHWSMCFG